MLGFPPVGRHIEHGHGNIVQVYPAADADPPRDRPGMQVRVDDAWDADRLRPRRRKWIPVTGEPLRMDRSPQNRRRPQNDNVPKNSNTNNNNDGASFVNEFAVMKNQRVSHHEPTNQTKTNERRFLPSKFVLSVLLYRCAKKDSGTERNQNLRARMYE